MNEVFQVYEDVFLVKKRYPRLFGEDVHCETRMMEMFESGFCYPLTERHEDGHRIVLVRLQKWDSNVYSLNDAARLIGYVIAVLMEEEETQIAGISMIFDLSGATLKQLNHPSDLRDILNFSKLSICRHKKIFLVNTPPLAYFAIELIKSHISEKLNKMLSMMNDFDQLKTLMNPDLLPKEYGGKCPETEMMADFKRLRGEKKELLSKALDFKVDWKKVPREKFLLAEEALNVGSFRKLNID